MATMVLLIEARVEKEILESMVKVESHAPQPVGLVRVALQNMTPTFISLSPKIGNLLTIIIINSFDAKNMRNLNAEEDIVFLESPG